MSSQHREERPSAQFHSQRAVTVLGSMFAIVALGFFLGPHGRDFAGVGMLMIPLSLLALTSYAGESVRWARLISVAILATIALFLASGFAVQAEELLDARAPSESASSSADLLLQIWFVALMGFAGAALVFLAPVRRAIARVLPIDDQRFVHTIALAASVTLTASAFAPLIVLGEAPLTALAALAPASETGDASALYEHAYQLVWMLPTCVLLVGYGMRRSFSECLERLGLVAPSARQILWSMLMAFGLAILAALAGWLVTSAFESMGWSTTDSDAVGELMGDIISPAGALVVGISAGLGEELLVRGVLQPRLGIVLSNLVFTALHAGQYGWDLLAVIFLVGTAFGLVRKYSNTTMSAMVHGFYDIFLIMASLHA